MHDIGPNKKLNHLLAGFFGLIAVLPLYFGIDSLTFLPPGQRGFSYINLGLAALILGSSIWVLRRPPIAGAKLVFGHGGFEIEVRKPFRGKSGHDLKWSGIECITKWDAGGLNKSFVIQTRTQGKIAFSAAWVDTLPPVLIERLQDSAKEAGFSLEKQPFSLASVVKTRWVVEPFEAGTAE